MICKDEIRMCICMGLGNLYASHDTAMQEEDEEWLAEICSDIKFLQMVYDKL